MRESPKSFSAFLSKSLLDRLKNALRTRHYSYETEKAYVYWVNRFYPGKNPEAMTALEIQHFLTHLAVQEKVSASASTQNQALCALVFFYKNMLQESHW